MELREAVRIYVRRRWLGAVIVLITIIGTFSWQMFQPVRYSTSMSFSVNRANKEATPDYQYDGYYALQAADLFSQTLVSWMQTPSILVEIFDQAGLPTDDAAIRGLTSRFKTKKVAAQNVVVTFSSPTQSEAEKVAKAITDVTKRLTESVNRDSQNKSLFDLGVAKPVTTRVTYDPMLTLALSLIVGLVLALFIVPFVAYVAEAAGETKQ